jgi:hypothetical protein
MLRGTGKRRSYARWARRNEPSSRRERYVNAHRNDQDGPEK